MLLNVLDQVLELSQVELLTAVFFLYSGREVTSF